MTITDIITPYLPEAARAPLVESLRRWRDRGAKDRQDLTDYLVGEAEDQDAQADHFANAIVAAEKRGGPVPEALRQELQEARAWAATDRAAAALLRALEAAFEAEVAQ